MFIPDFLRKLGESSEENRAWVDSLPFIIEKLRSKWELELGKPFLENASCSYVAPCIAKGYGNAVVKIGLPHPEALHEIAGLNLLKGNPTVKLFNYDLKFNAMLLEESLPGTALKEMAQPLQDEVICELLTVIWKADHKRGNFRPLAEMIRQWNDETYKNLSSFQDPDLAKKGCRLKEALIKSSPEQVFLATDLHAANVLKAQRKPWLVIDIKPYIGDRCYDLTQHLLNCTNRLNINPEKTIRRVAKLGGVPYERLKDWMFARLATENHGKHQNLAARIR